MKKLRDVERPRGLRRLLYRLPIAFYRVGLGRLLGGRFLLLEHRGRRSGATRRTVLEVLRRDAASETWYVASGWGERADWYRNLRHDPRAGIRVGSRRVRVEARLLSSEEGEREVLRYGRDHPRAARGVARLLGYEIDGSDADLRALAALQRTFALVSLDVAATSAPPRPRARC